MVRAWGNKIPDLPPKELGKLSIFGKLMPEAWVDYGNIPHIHQMERGNLDSKTKCLAFISAYLMRTAPKIAPHWVINAKQLGATELEILEAAIVAVEATAKAKMAEVDEVMTKIFNDPAFINAKDETK